MGFAKPEYHVIVAKDDTHWLGVTEKTYFDNNCNALLRDTFGDYSISAAVYVMSDTMEWIAERLYDSQHEDLVNLDNLSIVVKSHSCYIKDCCTLKMRFGDYFIDAQGQKKTLASTS